MARPTIQEIYGTLDYHTWKSGYDIQEQLRANRGLPKSLPNGIWPIIKFMFRDPSALSKDTTLNFLVEEGFVDETRREFDLKDKMDLGVKDEPIYRKSMKKTPEEFEALFPHRTTF